MSKVVTLSTRTKIVESAMTLIQQQGIAATGVLGILEQAAAPRGSLYHYFPAGKSQLVSEALQRSADLTTDALARLLETAPDAQSAIVRYVDLVTAIFESSGHRAGCPLATAVLEEAATVDEVASIGASAFATWTDLLAGALRRSGVDRPDDFALLAVTSVEGALILARARRDVEPLRRVAATLADVVALHA